VLGHWTTEEASALTGRVETAVEIVKTFASTGIQAAMNAYNNK
jgi:hypothetical protein